LPIRITCDDNSGSSIFKARNYWSGQQIAEQSGRPIEPRATPAKIVQIVLE
jgi:hypothetical protein